MTQNDRKTGQTPKGVPQERLPVYRPERFDNTNPPPVELGDYVRRVGK